MSDDDLIRDAVHELVAAAPSPTPLPAGGAGRSPYRWLAVAAAVILVIGGIVAIAWSQTDDDAAPQVATTLPPPQPTPPPATVATSTSPATSPQTVPGPPSTDSAPVASTSPSTTSTTTTTSTSTTTTTTGPPTPEQAQIENYLADIANARYDDAAALLREGGLELEARADLRPLFTEYGNVDDLAARLNSWCTDKAICTAPDAPPVDIGGYWLATWTTPAGAVTGYFRSGSFEGSPSVGGLPPRRPPSAAVGACPTSNVEAVREADIDGDGDPEAIVVTGSGPADRLVNVCNTALSVPPLQLPAGTSIVIGVLQPTAEPSATLLIGDAGESSSCGATYRLAASAGALVQVGWQGCWGGNGESIGCRDVNGESSIVAYRYTFAGGDRLDNSTSMNVDVLSLDGAPLDSFTLTLPDQIEQGLTIVEPHCNGLPVITYG